MVGSLPDKFFEKARNEGLSAAAKKTGRWLVNRPNQGFRRRAVRLANNYLAPNGWRNRVPRDDLGPTPWFTYPAIRFLRDIISPTMRVFEYGSGFSTKFFNSHALEVVSVEHDPKWANVLLGDGSDYDIRIRPAGYKHTPDYDWVINEFNSLKLCQPTSGSLAYDTEHGLLNAEFAGYAAEILTQPKGHFDIVVIDGMARMLSGYVAAQAVSENGFLIPRCLT